MDTPEQTDKPKGIEFYGGYEVYSESGVDLTLLRANLRLSLEERWEKGRYAMAFASALQQSGRSHGEFTLPSDNPSERMGALALVKLLAANHVPYVIVGGQAMYAHGSVYATQVIDICYSRTPANLSALVTAFASIHPFLRGAPPELSFRLDVPTLASGVNFLLATDYGYVNLLGGVNGIGGYGRVLAQSEERTVFGLTARILSLEGLIAAKKAAGRVKDRLHLLELEELKKLRDAARQMPEG